jgi:serine/threonine protein kinase
MATEIAQALAAIHRCGVIHGDIRLENILVFENHGQPKAKIGNFSNCALDTGDEIRLPGKKSYYTAPEADQPASASLLKQTDVYSYGLVFAAFVLDLDIARNLGIPEHSLEKDKQDNAVLDTMVAMAFEVDQFDGSRSQSLRSKLTTQVLELTLQRDPRRRDLQQVLVLLSGVYVPTRFRPPRRFAADTRIAHCPLIPASAKSS